jgi:hypothetical protein
VNLPCRLKPSAKAHLSYTKAEAERMLSGKHYATYLALWEWSGFRFSGRAGDKQDAFWHKFGRDAFYARINKIRAACGFTPLIDPME